MRVDCENAVILVVIVTRLVGLVALVRDENKGVTEGEGEIEETWVKFDEYELERTELGRTDGNKAVKFLFVVVSSTICSPYIFTKEWTENGRGEGDKTEQFPPVML